MLIRFLVRALLVGAIVLCTLIEVIVLVFLACVNLLECTVLGLLSRKEPKEWTYEKTNLRSVICAGANGRNTLLSILHGLCPSTSESSGPRNEKIREPFRDELPVIDVYPTVVPEDELPLAEVETRQGGFTRRLTEGCLRK